MRILVTGATGFIGSHLCKRLLSEGHAVTAFMRATSNSSTLNNLGVEHAIGDIRDADLVNRAIQGNDVVIHAAADVTIWRQARQTQFSVNVLGTSHVVQACLQNSVQCLIYVSSSAAIGLVDDPCQSADENFVFNLERQKLNYHLSKHEAEKIVSRAVGNGLNAVIVNPASVFGPYGKSYRGAQIIESIRRRVIVPYFRGGMSPVHVEDVIDGVISAMSCGRRGQRYILSGENLTNRQMLEMVAQYLGLKRRFVSIPSWATGLAAAVLEPIGGITGIHPPITYDLHYAANRYEFYDSRKAKIELGYAPRPFIEIVKEYLEHVKK